MKELHKYSLLRVALAFWLLVSSIGANIRIWLSSAELGSTLTCCSCPPEISHDDCNLTHFGCDQHLETLPKSNDRRVTRGTICLFRNPALSESNHGSHWHGADLCVICRFAATPMDGASFEAPFLFELLPQFVELLPEFCLVAELRTAIFIRGPPLV